MMGKKVVIFYFSGTGNTWWVTETLAEHLMQGGWEITVHSIEAISPGQADAMIKVCDMVGFGYPIYGSDVPEPMKQFMTALSPSGGKDTFIYCSQWMWSGDGARAGADFLKGKGFEVKWGEHILMPSNVCVTVLSFLPYTNDRVKIHKKLDRAEKRIKRFSNRIADGHLFRRGFNPVSFVLGILQRGPLRSAFDRLRDDMQVDSKVCTMCGECVRLCPSKNLMLEDGCIKTRGTCILCLRCYDYCPVSAVTYMGKAHNPKRGEPYKGPIEGFNPRILKE